MSNNRALCEKLGISVSEDGQRVLDLIPQLEEFYNSIPKVISGGRDDVYFQIKPVDAISDPILTICVKRDEYNSCDIFNDDNYLNELSCIIQPAEYFKALENLKAGEVTTFEANGKYSYIDSSFGTDVTNPYDNDDIRQANFLFKILLSPDKNCVTTTVMVQNSDQNYDLFGVCVSTKDRPRTDKTMW